jgi:hypothetical protein
LLGVLLGAVAFGLFGVVQRVMAASNPLPAVMQRAATPADALPSAAATAMSADGFDVSSARQIGKNVYVVPKTGGFLCTVSLTNVGGGAGCQPSSNFFAGNQLVFGVADNGPGSSTVRIAGVAQTGVTEVRLTVGGSTTTVQTTSDGGFSVDVPVPNGTDAGASLGTVDAIDASGKVLQSFALPSS